MGILDDGTIRRLLLQAWLESQPGTPNAHEEGGFVLRNADGSLIVERWPTGALDEIHVPVHWGGFCDNRPIVATFHTHPNTGPDYQQERAQSDIRGVRDDPDLSHADYEGEYVISKGWIYLIRKNGQVDLVGETNATFGAS